mgnify:CR=1 FL=1
MVQWWLKTMDILKENEFKQELANVIKSILVKYGIQNVYVVIPQQNEITEVNNSRNIFVVNKPLDQMPVS